MRPESRDAIVANVHSRNLRARIDVIASYAM
jgi:hypothetical protein